MRAPFARMVVEVKRRSGVKKRLGGPVGAPALVRRRPPPAVGAGTVADRGGVGP
ncbi:MAG TPA: hypothetical protein VGM69_13740 [Chloroflexota bacterium]|jgi:hypothetical protein